MNLKIKLKLYNELQSNWNQRVKIKELFEMWRCHEDDKNNYDQSIDLLNKFKQQTSQVSASLCE